MRVYVIKRFSLVSKIKTLKNRMHHHFLEVEKLSHTTRRGNPWILYLHNLSRSQFYFKHLCKWVKEKKLQNIVLTKNFRKVIMMSPFRKRSIHILKLSNDYFESVTQQNSMIYLILWKLCFLQYYDTAISVIQILTPVMT